MPTNTFTPNMPASGNSLGFTRPLVLGNFGNYKENMEVNHLGVNSADFGKHKFLQMPVQASAPTTAALEGGFYTKKIPTTLAEAQLYYRRESDGDEFGMAFLSGTTAYPGTAGDTSVLDFSPYSTANGVSGLVGRFFAYSGAHTDEVNLWVDISVINNVYNISYPIVQQTPGSTTDLTTDIVYNFGVAGVLLYFSGSILTMQRYSAVGPPAKILPTASTLTWRFSGNYY